MAALQSYAEPGSLRVSRLPIDVVTCIMELLPQADLWRAASASREFNAAAHVAGLELHRTVTLRNEPPYLSLSDSRTLATFLAVVKHMLRKRRHAELALTLDCIGCVHDDDLPAMREYIDHALVRPLQLYSGLVRPLELLVRLRVLMPASVGIGNEMMEALAMPAPRLRSFLLYREFALEQHPHYTMFLRPTLFYGWAPRLLDVTLCNAAVELRRAATIPAFARVRRVTLHCSRPRRIIGLAAAFPAVRALRLTAGAYGGNTAGGPRTSVDLSRLSLDWLAITDATADGAFEYAARPRAVAAVDYICDAIEHHGPLWPAGAPELTAHVRRTRAGGIAAVFKENAQECAWKHTIWSLRGVAQLVSLPPLHTQLVTLALEESLLGQLVSTPRKLGALRQLYVDFTVSVTRSRVRLEQGSVLSALPPAPHVLEHMPCARFLLEAPALKIIIVFARRFNVRVASHTLTTLALALGQLKVPRLEDRAELHLAGVQLDDPRAALPLLRQTFRAVRKL